VSGVSARIRLESSLWSRTVSSFVRVGIVAG
jgi:hypothetical protein